MRTGNGLPSAPRGFTYLAVLIALAIIGATLASTGTVWHTAVQREKERELLFVGDQIRQGIGRYYNSTKSSNSNPPVKQYPQTLEDLLRDPREAGIIRHLRKLYVDPITATTEWGLVKGRDGRITGVYSLSSERPRKQTNFGGSDQTFAEQEKYSDWKFIYQPQGVPNPAVQQADTTATPSPTPSGTPR